MKQLKLGKSRIKSHFENSSLLRYAVQIFLTGIAVYSDFFEANRNFYIFLISFALTFVNVQRAFGIALSLPLTVIHFLGFQLVGLLVSPRLSSIVSLEKLSEILLIIPIFVSLPIKNSDKSKRRHKLEFSTVIDVLVTILPTFFALGLFLKSMAKYPNGWAFWALGGDSRNFLVASINTVNSNGITESLLAKGPIFPSALIGLLNPTFSQESKFGSYFQIMALLEFFFLSLSSILLAIFAKQLLVKLSFRNPAVVLTTSAIPFSGLYSGVLQRDGFFGIAILLPIFVSLLILLLEILDKNALKKTRIYLYFSGSLILPILIFLTWTPFSIFALMYVYFGYRAIQFRLIKYWQLCMLTIFSNFVLFYYCLKPFVNSISADSQLTSRGAITPPNILMFLLVLMYFVYNINTKITPDSKSHAINGILVFISLGGLANLFLIGIQPFEAKWNYYPSKFGWVWLVASFPIVVSIFWLNFSKLLQEKDYFFFIKWIMKFEKNVKNATGVFVAMFSLFLLYVLQPPVPSPWIHPWYNALAKGQFGAYSQVLNGWAAPSPEALTRINSIASSSRQPIFFKYFANPSDDRMSNFLLVLNSLNTDGTQNPIGGKLSGYAYFADPTDIKSICDLVDGSQSDLIVLTKSETFESDFDSTCKLDRRNLEILVEN